MAMHIRLCAAIALAFLLFASGTGVAQAQADAVAPQADPAIWGIYARLVGTEWEAEPGSGLEPLRWNWGQGEHAGSIIEAGAPNTGTYTLKPGPEPGTLTSDFSRGVHHYRGIVAADGSVLWIRKGWIKKAHRVSLVGSKLQLEVVKVVDDRVAEVQATYHYANAAGTVSAVATAPEVQDADANVSTAAPATMPAAEPLARPVAVRPAMMMPGIPKGAIPATEAQVAAALAARDVVAGGDEQAIRAFMALPEGYRKRQLRWSILGVQSLGEQDPARTAWVMPGDPQRVVVPHLQGWDLGVTYRDGKPIEATALAWPLDPARWGIYSRLVGHYAQSFTPVPEGYAKTYYAWKTSPSGAVVEYIVIDGNNAGIMSVITVLPVPGQLGRIQGVGEGDWKTSLGVIQSDGSVVWTPLRNNRIEHWRVTGNLVSAPALNWSGDKRTDSRRILRGFFHDMMDKVQGGDARVTLMAARLPTVMRGDLQHHAKVQETIRRNRASSARYDRFNAAMGALNSALTAADREADTRLRSTEADYAATMGALKAQAAAQAAEKAQAKAAAQAAAERRTEVLARQPAVEDARDRGMPSASASASDDGTPAQSGGLTIEDRQPPQPAPAPVTEGHDPEQHLICMVLDFGSEFTSKPGAVFVSAPGKVRLVDGRVPAGIREGFHDKVKARYDAGGNAYCKTTDTGSNLERYRREWFGAHPKFEHVSTGISPI